MWCDFMCEICVCNECENDCNTCEKVFECYKRLKNAILLVKIANETNLL